MGSAFGHAVLQGEAFYSYNDFVSRCIPDEPNEIVFVRPYSFGNFPVGIFMREGVSEEQREFLCSLAKLLEIPVCEYTDGVLTVRKV